MTHSERFARIVKANDIRGIVGTDLTAEVAGAVGAAFVEVMGYEGGQVIVGHDMRSSAGTLAPALIEGIRSRGASVIDIGMVSTDELYFASGSRGLPATMLTASHNPAEYNGIKFCRPGAKPLSRADGLEEIADRAEQMLEDPAGSAGSVGPSAAVGGHETATVHDDYADALLSIVPVPDGRPLTVVVDAGNGMGGVTAPAVLARVPGVSIDGLYLEPDGTFPHHPPNPLVPENLLDARARVAATGADLGLVFDGDADRCFVIDERGRAVRPSAITLIIARTLVAREQGAGVERPTVLYNLISSRAVPEILATWGADSIRTPVGHAIIKEIMASSGAVFGGEHSGHYYFRDFFGADSGMIAALTVLAELRREDRPLSELITAIDPYWASGEINFAVPGPLEVIETIEHAVASRHESVVLDRLDGLTVDHWSAGAEPALGVSGRWWANIRPSNTEDLLRLNVEAEDEAAGLRVVEEVRALIGRAVGSSDLSPV